MVDNSSVGKESCVIGSSSTADLYSLLVQVGVMKSMLSEVKRMLTTLGSRLQRMSVDRSQVEFITPAIDDIDRPRLRRLIEIVRAREEKGDNHATDYRAAL